MQWYIGVLKKYAVFGGRARRKEYWMFFLVHLLVTVVLAVLDGAMGLGNATSGAGVLSGLYGLAVLIPGLAVTVRRLHDTGHSGWWVLIGLVPLIGAIVLLVFLVTDGDASDNGFGVNPQQAAA